MRYPFNGSYPISRPFIVYDLNMPERLWDPVYGPTHRGIDWALPIGTPLVAAISGTVTLAGDPEDGAGIAVVIRSGSMLVKCFHMSSLAVKFGDKVTEGQAIGKSGKSGNSTGAHLHFQVEDPAKLAVDPMKYLKEVTVMDRETINYIFRIGLLREPTEEEVVDWQKPDRTPLLLARGLHADKRHQELEYKALHYNEDIAKAKTESGGEAAKVLANLKSALEPVLK